MAVLLEIIKKSPLQADGVLRIQNTEYRSQESGVSMEEPDF
jgi:hypothetical protein